MYDWVRHLYTKREHERVAGAPASVNGASTFFLWFGLPYGERIAEISATLEVTERPEIESLISFAIQSALSRPQAGSIHLGLQHNPLFPNNGALRLDGYTADGERLTTSEPEIPSATNDVTTRDYPWKQGVKYTLSIRRGAEIDDGQFPWSGYITDHISGDTVMIREMISTSTHLRAPILYVESHAPCDSPPFEVRWSDVSTVSVKGGKRSIRFMRADYQLYAAGGCTNTDSFTEGVGLVERTGEKRTTNSGRTIRID